MYYKLQTLTVTGIWRDYSGLDYRHFVVFQVGWRQNADIYGYFFHTEISASCWRQASLTCKWKFLIWYFKY